MSDGRGAATNAAAVAEAARPIGPSLAGRLLDPPHARPLDPGRDPLPPPLRPGAALGVLDVTKWFGPSTGGVRTYLLEKAAYVTRDPRLRQVLVVPGARDLVADADGVRCYQLRSPPVPGQAPYRLLLRGGALRRVAGHERPHLIEAGSPLLVPWMAARAARALGVPLVGFHHGLLPHGMRSHAARAAAWRYLRRLDHLFAVTLVGSDFAAAELRAAGITRTVRAPLGVDLDRFHPDRRLRARAVRRAHGLPEDAPLVGFVGRFAGEKRLELAVGAWPAVARRSCAVLVLVGDGPRRARLERLAAGVPVRFLPFQRDRDAVADLIASFDLLLSAGEIETFGLAALEAMACGTPVLSADRGGVAELVQRSGAGRTFAAGSAAALADEACALLREDLAALGRAGRAYAEREHAWEVAFGRIFAIYAEVAGRR
ncbi:MAG TPA: glycosyltransferase [Gemmatimonadaceae bacterium]|nr:glycosyltransferase [Gemmatimonadaceae bacterium]